MLFLLCVFTSVFMGVFLLGMVESVCAAEAMRPVYPEEGSAERVEQLKKVVSAVMELSEQEMVDLVPDKTGFLFMGCPNCDAGTQEGQLSWTLEDPYHVTCKFCEMVFPNEKFPEDRVMKVMNPVGEEVEYSYWEDESGYKYFFSARGWRAARSYFSGIAHNFGALYQMTADGQYARRAALILDAFGRYYPGFLVSKDWPHRPKGFALEPPYPSGGGKWGRWRHDEMPSNLVYAYDSICGSGELERLSEELGVDVKARIENDFFRGAIRQDQFHETDYSNAAPRIYEGYVAIGRVLGDPGLVHEGVRQSRGLFERQFYEDGFWLEGSVGYHQMTMHGMAQVFDAARGYSDPPGYVDPEDGTRFDDLNLERDLAVVARAKRIEDICRYPDGRVITIHDSWAHFRNLKVPERSESTLLAGVGHAWLGQGEGKEQAQLHLHFSGGYGHEHADNLQMTLFAKGLELLPDVGYTHTRHRMWSTSTLGHNTVVIDETRQYTRGKKGPSDGRLLAFEVAHDGVQWMAASGERGYPGLQRLFEDRLMLVQAEGAEVYAVDLFEVAGGSQHDWALHGSADADGWVGMDVMMKHFGENLLPGVKVQFPEGEADSGDAEGRNSAYAYFQNVSRGEVEHGLTMTFTVEHSSVGVRTHVPGQRGAEVFAGDAMSFRRAEENDVLQDKFRMPIALVRRKGTAPLASVFAAVHEPYEDAPFVDTVGVDDAGENAVALSITHHGVTDHIVYRTGKGPVEVGDLHLDGEMGFVRERDGVPERMGLWGGATLRWKGYTVTGSGVYEGDVTGTLRKDAGDECDGLVVTGAFPKGEALKGATAVVELGDGSTRGCRVLSVVSGEGESHLVLEADPGFAVTETGAKHLFFPLRAIEGPVRVRVRTSALIEVADGEVKAVGEARFLKEGE
ncbi:MAG: heparinase II/III family protein [bacterium]|nr:heparinase II/III family protein [bacterium]